LIHFQNLEIGWNLFSGSNMLPVIIPVKIGPCDEYQGGPKFLKRGPSSINVTIYECTNVHHTCSPAMIAT